MAIIELNKSNFEKETDTDKPMIIDFWAPWCGPCNMLGPIIDKLSKEIQDVIFAKVNVQVEQEIAQKHDIRSIPCLILYKNKKEVERIVGVQSEEVLKEKLEALKQ